MTVIFAGLVGVSQSANAGVIDRSIVIRVMMANLFLGIPIFSGK